MLVKRDGDEVVVTLAQSSGALAERLSLNQARELAIVLRELAAEPTPPKPVDRGRQDPTDLPPDDAAQTERTVRKALQRKNDEDEPS